MVRYCRVLCISAVLIVALVSLSLSAPKHTLMREDAGVCNPLAYGSSLNDTTLSAAIAGCTEKTLMITPGTWAITANVTIPTGWTLKVASGATLSVSTGKVLNFDYGSDIADVTRKIFTCVAGENCVTFDSGASAASHTRPEWWGAVVSDGTDDLEAFDRAVGAIDDNSGGKILLLQGYYNLSDGWDISSQEFLHIQGTNQKWETGPDQADGTMLIVADAATRAAIYGVDARHLTLRDVNIRATTDGGAAAALHGIYLENSVVDFGCHYDIERASIYWTTDGIHLKGACTAVYMGHLYIRGMQDEGIEVEDGMSTGTFQDIYISAPDGDGLLMSDGCGNCLFDTIITENTAVGSDGMNLLGIERSTFNSIYLGDGVGGNGLHLITSKANTFNGLHVSMASSATGSDILLDGSHSNIFTSATLTGSPRYMVEWVDTTAINAQVKRKNIFRNFVRSSNSMLGFTNDWSYIEIDNESPQSHDTRTMSGVVVTNLSPMWQTHALGDYWTLRSQDVPAITSTSPYPIPIGDERWSFFRNNPGLDNYSWMGRSDANTVGVLSNSENLGTSLVTGDDSDCDTTGTWSATPPDTITSVAGGVVGNGCQWTTGGSGALLSGAILSLNTLTSGRLYKLTVALKVSAAGTIRVYFSPYDDADAAALVVSEWLFNNTTSFKTYTLYFVADGTKTKIRFSRNTNTTGDYVLFDNMLLQEVKSDGSLALAGGRLSGTGEGGGGTITLYGDQHATYPTSARIAGRAGYVPQNITIASTGDANPATLTLEPTSGYVGINCADPDTCDITMGETDAWDGQMVTIVVVNASAAVADFTDSAGVLELSATPLALAANDVLQLLYSTDRWVEVSRSNN